MVTKFKDNKGAIGSDALIAVAILVLFLGLILTLSYNIFLSNASLKRMSTATNYITELFEYSKEVDYDELTEEKLKSKIYNNGKISFVNENTWDKKGYNIQIKVEKYNEKEENTDKLDLIKEVKIKVQYYLLGKKQEIEMSTIKKRENLEYPNKPNLEIIEGTINNKENIYPIKYADENWYVTNITDKKWYNYEEGIWALIFITEDDLNENEIIDIDENNKENVKVWIPKYAYNSEENDIKFLYYLTNKYVVITDSISTLSEEINGDYIIGPTVMQPNDTGSWYNLEDAQDEILNDIYEFKNIP